MADYFLLEDGSGYFQLEDGTGNYVLDAPVAFPTAATITTAFTGADENPISEGGIWSATGVYTGVPTARRVSNQLAGIGTDSHPNLVASDAADCERYIDITNRSGFTLLELWVRGTGFNTAAPSGYAVGVYSSGKIRLSKVVSDVQTFLADVVQAVATGDSIGIRCVGSEIQAWYKASGGAWTWLATVTDSSLSAGGKFGIVSSGTVNGTAFADNLGGGAYSAVGTNALLGSSAGTSTASAGISIDRTLSGATTGTSSAADVLTVARSLGAITTGTSATTGGVSIARPLTAATTGTSDSAAAISITRALGAVTTGVSDATSTITNVVPTIPVGGSAIGTSDATASATVARALTGSTTGTSSTVGAASITRMLAAASTGTSGSAGAVSVARSLAAASTGTSTAAATVSNAAIGTNAISGAATGTSTASASAGVARSLGAITAGTSSTSAAVTIARPLAGSSDGASIAVAAVSLYRQLAGLSDGTSDAAATLTVATANPGALITVSVTALVPAGESFEFTPARLFCSGGEIIVPTKVKVAAAATNRTVAIPLLAPDGHAARYAVRFGSTGQKKWIDLTGGISPIDLYDLIDAAF